MPSVSPARKELPSFISKIWHGVTSATAGYLVLGVLAQSRTHNPLNYADASAALAELVTAGLTSTVIAFVLMGSIAVLCTRAHPRKSSYL